MERFDETAAAHISSVFARFDENGDGQIDAGELSSVLKALDKAAWTDERVSLLFGIMDTSQDGFIQREEFVNWVFADDCNLPCADGTDMLTLHNAFREVADASCKTQAKNWKPISEKRSKEGLQVQMADDAVQLGIAHAALNVVLSSYLCPMEEDGVCWSCYLARYPDLQRAFGPTNVAAAKKHFVGNGKKEGRDAQCSGNCDKFLNSEVFADVEVWPGWVLSGRQLANGLDKRVRPLAEADMEIYFILLACKTNNATLDDMLLDPRHTDGGHDGRSKTHHIAFRVMDEDGRNALTKAMSALARRYGPESSIGYVRGWIVGNEVNVHGSWYNLGPVPLPALVDAYEMAVRLIYEAISVTDPTCRVYISMEHHWARAITGNELCCSGRALLDAFAARARDRGDFPWHVAFHPYPENLFECRFWMDKEAQRGDYSPKVTLKNINVLTDYLRNKSLLWEGTPRRVILSEQGFHVRNDDSGEHDQACAFALAWQKVKRDEIIDAFIIHRHVDHKYEGGLRLGLYTRDPDSTNNPDRKRTMWQLLQTCGSQEGVDMLAPYLRAATSSRYTLQKKTVLHETDATASLHLLEGKRMLVIKKLRTGSGMVEVHITKEDFDEWALHTSTALPEVEASVQFDVDQATGDVYCFKLAKESAMEVFILDAQTNYQTLNSVTETGLHGCDPHKFSVHLGPAQDIYCLKLNQTGSKSCEVHVLSKKSGYKEFSAHFPSGLGEVGHADGSFQVDQSKGDVIFFKQAQTESRSIEVSILSAPTYRNCHWTTTCVTDVNSKYQFAIHRHGYCAFKQSSTGSNTTEVHMFTA